MTVSTMGDAIDRIAKDNGWTKLPGASSWTKGKRRVDVVSRGFTASGPKQGSRYAYRDCFSGKLQDLVDIFEERSLLWEDISR